MILKAYGYDVIGKAKNGEEAINMYTSLPNKPDVVIMDHRMPVKNGIEATKEIFQIDENARIIFASADESVKDTALLIGAVSFKTKPFDYERLIDNIEKALLIPLKEN